MEEPFGIEVTGGLIATVPERS